MESCEEFEKTPAAVRSQAERVCNELMKLRQIAGDECGLSPQLANAIDVPIEWSAHYSAHEFADKVFSKFRQAASEAGPIRRGRVYCYHCRSSACEHSAPASSSSVFAGYQDTGRPQWSEFFNYILRTDDRRVDQLFSQNPAILARVVGRKQLIAEQLVTFGRRSMTYRIIGQTVAGYIRIRSLKFALTAQVVETRNRRLLFQLITSEEVREALVNVTDDGRTTYQRILEDLHAAEHRVALLTDQWMRSQTREQRREIHGRVFAVLRHLASSLERKGRQFYRRTSHAERRSKDKRPVHKAHDDLKFAGVDDFFRDRATRSIVVIGKNGRSHIFSPAGRHITSLVITAEKLGHRQRRKRYVALSAEEVDNFKNQTLADFEMKPEV